MFYHNPTRTNIAIAFIAFLLGFVLVKNRKFLIKQKQSRWNNVTLLLGNISEYDKLGKQIRILCWIMTSPFTSVKRAKHIKATWGKRCNILLFMSSHYDSYLPTVALDVKEGRNFLWAKTRKSFQYIYEKHLTESDWFLKADDDTYVIMENLRYMLQAHSPKEAIYFGCKFKPFVEQGYMSGGAGYVVSRTALQLMVEVGFRDILKCRSGDKNDYSSISEDVEMGKCMENLGVKAGDSRDTFGINRFFPFVPQLHLMTGHVPKDNWYWRYIFYPSGDGLDCCSDSAISFHYVSPGEMHIMEYLLYKLRPYGIDNIVKLKIS